ncbi:hypothetical protein [Photobacterium chitinilyticum]|uniref:Uncharacterized protein n=1 Tax=Photobacterium chitinilyticum TaxID=2485123 RepID=A0A444JRU7_9GAMM|nr:hypothetical protein [Photobacterium chitinilyticum]RWX55780.1 hypothetical protein EDI28_10620 [Photobacterium chitinilyticum]
MNKSNFKILIPLCCLILLAFTLAIAYQAYKALYYSGLDEHDHYWENTAELQNGREFENEEKLVKQSTERDVGLRDEFAFSLDSIDFPDRFLMLEASPLRMEGHDLSLTRGKVFSGIVDEGSNPLLEEYKAIIEIEKEIKLPGPSGILSVWIGSEDFEPEIPNLFARNEAPLKFPFGSVNSAKVTPNGYDYFEFGPDEEECFLVSPFGNEVQFNVRPLKMEEGTYKIGAKVELFASYECNGTAINVYPDRLDVFVDVSFPNIVREGLIILSKTTWEEIVKFWKSLIVLIFTTILFLLRRKIKTMIELKNAH